MPNYLTPGVYVEEVAKLPPLIETRPSGVTAFLGSARKGMSYRACEIRSFAAFVSRFGALKTELELGYAVSQFFANGGVTAWVVRVAQRPSLTKWQRGLAALDLVQDLDLLAIPGVESAPLRDAALSYAQGRKAFLLFDGPRAAASVALMHRAEATLPVSADAAVYFPWIEVADPAGAALGAKRVSAPSGSVAGVMARIDAVRGIWTAPSGANAVINGATALAVSVNNQENDELNGLAINCLRDFPGKGRLIYGARTRAGGNGGDPEWRYVPVRRLALLLERSLERGLQWVASEPNGEKLWAQIRSSVDNFLMQYFRQGALLGTKPEQAYFVKCGRDTMTAADISAGMITVLIGFAPVKPAEFILLRLHLQARTV